MLEESFSFLLEFTFSFELRFKLITVFSQKKIPKNPENDGNYSDCYKN